MNGKPDLVLEGDFSRSPVSLTSYKPFEGASEETPWRVDVPEGSWAALWRGVLPEAACAIMVVLGQINDWAAYNHYLQGLREGRLLEQHGARPILFGAPAEVLFGRYGPQRATVAISFPSLDDIKAFWSSDAYSAVRTRREGAADLHVGVWTIGAAKL